MIVFSHPDCLGHDPGQGHPESPERLRTLLARLEADGRFPVRTAAAAPRDALLAVHPAGYLDALEHLAAAGGGELDPDTVMSAGSWSAAVAGAGACLEALASALAGTPAFAACRPPGHHALADRAMGFCLLANAVIVARAARREGVEPVLIVDWDVHHGNGTQALVEQDPAVRYVSLHQWPAYPGTGRADERGVGNVFNIPRSPGLPPGQYVEALWDGIVAATTGWSPALLVVSAGFDAMAGDPLAGFTLEPGHYAEWTRRLRDRFPAAAMVGVLEGGYVPRRLADGVLAHLTAA
ncbi:MAG TPA: histone deacetylase [Gemmatimonadales bacterium]